MGCVFNIQYFTEHNISLEGTRLTIVSREAKKKQVVRDE